MIRNFVKKTRIDNRLPAILGERKMSIRELSKATGVTYTMIRDVYHGERQSIKFDVVEKICKELGIQPGDIFVYVSEGEE